MGIVGELRFLPLLRWVCKQETQLAPLPPDTCRELGAEHGEALFSSLGPTDWPEKGLGLLHNTVQDKVGLEGREDP